MTVLHDEPVIVEKLPDRRIDARWRLGDDEPTGGQLVLAITAAYHRNPKRYFAHAATVRVDRAVSLHDDLPYPDSREVVEIVDLRAAKYSEDRLRAVFENVVAVFRGADGQRQLAGLRRVHVKRANPDQLQRIAERLRGGADPSQIYVDRHSGKAILGQLRRYLDTEDANKIDDALYKFLMSVGFIAHYSLGEGFRAAYTEPIDLIEEFLHHRLGEVRWRRGDTGHVYTDGLIEPEVYRRAKAMILAAEPRARGNREARQRARLRASVQAGAAALGMRLVPNHQ